MIPRGVSLHLGLRVFIHVFLNFIAGVSRFSCHNSLFFSSNFGNSGALPIKNLPTTFLVA